MGNKAYTIKCSPAAYILLSPYLVLFQRTLRAVLDWGDDRGGGGQGLGHNAPHFPPLCLKNLCKWSPRPSFGKRTLCAQLALMTSPELSEERNVFCTLACQHMVWHGLMRLTTAFLAQDGGHEAFAAEKTHTHKQTTSAGQELILSAGP